MVYFDNELLISTCKKLGLSEVEEVLQYGSDYDGTVKKVLIKFKNGESKEVRLKNYGVTNLGFDGDYIKRQLLEDIPYMDRKMRGYV